MEDKLRSRGRLFIGGLDTTWVAGERGCSRLDQL